ncbi:4-hydroxy-3-polyprenylbenzoate decarboxylase [Sporomusaceae bacterium BoRhaA]|uniref:UbiX family flavin prenyltransferase n=1 Tax=Pelorhabdus rhamnosifermentans TaxID=2772457 RepID=UPI001C064005|nr:UbiX family flavin prenyltransferase [Pelorhabdus rhamnosifermentans]MBU2702436.1 4-hydroxy-3-polyprenylbenzoate decarboxylase [Pelorhabdus rhamnosifermentans]
MENHLKASHKKRLVIGMSGASGAILGIDILKTLRENPEWETHLVISSSAERTIAEETEYPLDEVFHLADKVYDINNIGASIASGTFKTAGMIIIPCSMKTVAGIVCGYSDNLLLRAADVTIKERRNLVVVPRESPLSMIHLRNLLSLAEIGAMIIPPMVTYYHKPLSLEDMNRQIIGKILDGFGIEVAGFNRWGENV